MNVFSILVLAQLFPPLAPCEEPVPEKPQDSRKFYVIVGTNRESRMMAAELTRDWMVKRCPELERLRQLQCEVCRRVEIQQPGREFRLVRDGYPFWKYGERGVVRYFDPRTFSDTGRPLETLAAMIHNETIDLQEWRSECDAIQQRAEYGHVQQATAWLRANVPDELKEFGATDTEFGVSPSAEFLRIQGRFQTYDGFPVYEEPQFPPKPLRPMPWE